MKTSFYLAAVLVLAACAATPSAPDENIQPGPVAEPPSKAAKELGSAITSPLSDLNLLRTQIPPILAATRQSPYQLPENPACADLAAEVEHLDAVLEPDFDTTPAQRERTVLERGAGEAGKAALGAVRSAAADVIPFRGWVRKLTGAERHSREVDGAIAAGIARRAFLKGWMHGKRCNTALVTAQP
jgi:hypothetical protein